MNQDTKKQFEKYCVDVFKRVYKHFPEGEMISDEGQERPDIVVKGTRGSIGIEVTRIVESHLKKEEAEFEAMVNEARLIYETKGLPCLWVTISSHTKAAFNKLNRKAFADKIANLVALNIPCINGWKELENDWHNPDVFPFEIDSFSINQNSKLSRNHWIVNSWGWIQENFGAKLQEILSQKEQSIGNYDKRCKEHWLLIVADHRGASSFYDGSESTLSHQYSSSFDKAFFLDLFKGSAFQLDLLKSP